MHTFAVSGLANLRITARGLRRRPGFTAAAVLTLALGLGATTAVFGVVYGVLIKPLPYPDPHELVSIRHLAPGHPFGSTGNPLGSADSMYVTYREQNRTFEHVGLWTDSQRTLTGLGEPQIVRTLVVTHGTLEALVAQPALGRGFTEAEHESTAGGADPVIVSYAFARHRFGNEQAALGRALALDDRQAHVVGVLPAGFRFLDLTPQPDLIVPMRIDRSQLALGNLNFNGIARLEDGATLADANADVARMLAIWLDAWPAPRGSREAIAEWRVTPALRPLQDDVVGDVASMLWLLMGAVGAVLLIACANIANLLLVRADGRRRELAVRAALGASRRRIAAELLRESLVLGLLGGAAGLAVTYAGLEALAAFAPANLPRVDAIAVDAPVLAFAVIAALVSGLSFGALPAVKHAFGSDGLLGPSGRDASASRERNRTRHALIVVQVALALVLLVGAGLMIRTFQALTAVDPGFTEPEKIQIVGVFIPPWVIREHERSWRIQLDILERIAALPGVTAASLGGTPLGGSGLGPGAAVSIEERPDAAVDSSATRFMAVSPGYFAALGTRLIAGRDITWADVEEARTVVLVSENFARAIWGEPRTALGKRIRWDSRAGPGAWREIIGVTQNVYGALHERPPTTVFAPTAISDLRGISYVIRSARAGTESFVNEVRQAVWSSHPEVPVTLARTMQDIYSDSLARTSFVLVLLAIAGAEALVLSVVGIYAVIAYSVAQRSREIGIRLALGAASPVVQRMFVMHGLAVAAVGIAAGLVGAAGLSRFVSSLLFGVRPIDPATFAAVVVVLVGAVSFAAYVPARRAAKLDPAATLRAD